MRKESVGEIVIVVENFTTMKDWLEEIREFCQEEWAFAKSHPEFYAIMFLVGLLMALIIMFMP